MVQGEQSRSREAVEVQLAELRMVLWDPVDALELQQVALASAKDEEASVRWDVGQYARVARVERVCCFEPIHSLLGEVDRLAGMEHGETHLAHGGAEGT